MLGEERPPTVPLEKIFRKLSAVCCVVLAVLHTLQVSVLGATAQIIPSVILASPIRNLHLSQDTGTSWVSRRRVEMEVMEGLVRPQPMAQVSLQ